MSRMSATQINQEVPDQAHTKFIPANLEEDCPMVTTHYRRSAFCQTVAAIKAILVELHIPKTYLCFLCQLGSKSKKKSGKIKIPLYKVDNNHYTTSLSSYNQN